MARLLLYLPLPPDPGRARRQPMSEQLKVLCVDDNEETARSTGELLEMAGFDVRVCHGGEAALAVAEEFRPDVCVIDLGMPGMAGDELATRLQEREDNP